jgi:malate synthase
MMDGAWTGHPDQNAIAVAQFPSPNQIHARPRNASRYPDLRPVPMGVGECTVQGTRAAVRTVIRYREGLLRGNGASLLDGYMEDLATDRIYRLMIAQRVRHRELINIWDELHRNVKHTPEFVTRLFDEELDRLLRELPASAGEQDRERFRRARELSEAMIVNGEFDPI